VTGSTAVVIIVVLALAVFLFAVDQALSAIVYQLFRFVGRS
jgi:preprotein translocase subunit SecE